MSNGVAANSAARDATSAAGTKKNCASGSTNFLISHGQATLSTCTFSRVIHLITSCLQLLVKPLEALDAFFQEVRVGDFASGPAGEDGIDPEAFRALKFSVFEIGVVYHFRDLQDGFIRN